MGDSNQLEIREEIFIEAEPSLVYEFFTVPELIERWHGISAEADPRPGGIFRLNVTGDEYQVGEFVALEPPHRIVFTWGHPEGVDNFPPGSSLVTVTLKAVDSGTRVHVHQVGFPDHAQRDLHSRGWCHYLTRLLDVAEGRDPGLDVWGNRDLL